METKHSSCHAENPQRLTRLGPGTTIASMVAAMPETVPKSDDAGSDLSFVQAMTLVRRVECLLEASTTSAPNPQAEARARIAKAVARELGEELAWLASQEVA